MLYSYKTTLPDPRYDRILTTKQTDRGERILNIVMIIVAILCVLIMGFFVVRRCVNLDNAAMAITQEEWTALGGGE